MEGNDKKYIYTQEYLNHVLDSLDANLNCHDVDRDTTLSNLQYIVDKLQKVPEVFLKIGGRSGPHMVRPKERVTYETYICEAEVEAVPKIASLLGKRVKVTVEEL